MSLFCKADIHGCDVGAMKENIQFGAKCFADIERLAMVEEMLWHHRLAIICVSFTKETLLSFDHTGVAMAKKRLE